MTRRELEDRILGCVVGASIGDSIGGAFEFQMRPYIQKRIGKDWIDEMYDYAGRGHGSYGVWSKRAPAGTGTDDTRMNHIFLEAVIENDGAINAQRLAAEYIRRYLHPERYYPKRVAPLARQHLVDFYGVSCGCLGMECPELPGVPVHALRERSFGLRFPTLIGLLSLACSGCLYKNQPSQAYEKAYELAYFDVGYAKEACGMQAAAVSMAIGGITDMATILRRLRRLDPLKLKGSTLGQYFDDLATEVTSSVLKLTKKAKDSRDLSLLLSRELANKHVFDPLDTLTVCFAANMFAQGDPKKAILIAANHRNVDEAGNLVRFRDNDCTGYVAGALAGALAGCKKLPQDWVNKVLASNKRIYGIDIEKNVYDFCNAVYGKG